GTWRGRARGRERQQARAWKPPTARLPLGNFRVEGHWSRTVTGCVGLRSVSRSCPASRLRGRQSGYAAGRPDTLVAITPPRSHRRDHTAAITPPRGLPVRLAVPEVVGHPDVTAVLPDADAHVLVAPVGEVVVVRATRPFALHLAIDP